MENFSEVIKIIEGGLEGNRTKVIAYANLLISKVSEKQQKIGEFAQSKLGDFSC